MFVDSTGRVYSLPAHTLPSARGQGEPLSGRLDPPDGATFAAVMIGEPSDRWLLACDAGYGFIAKLEDLYARNRGGKSVFNLPESARVLPASPVGADDALVCAVNSEGRLLAFPVADLPQMERGRGNLIFGVPGRKARSGEELMVAAVVAGRGAIDEVAFTPGAGPRPAIGATRAGAGVLPVRLCRFEGVSVSFHAVFL